MVSLRLLDRIKLYEDQSGMMSYVERIVRKAVNILERSYCSQLDHNAFEKRKKLQADSVIVSLTTFPARIGCFLCAILKNRESETIMASHPPLPSRSSCLLADIVLLNHVEREE